MAAFGVQPRCWASASPRSDAARVPLLSMLEIAPIPVWLVVHREIRTSARIRAVHGHLSKAVPMALTI